jgi:hypothetical protein
MLCFNFALTTALAVLVSGCSISHLAWIRNSEDVGRSFATLQVSLNNRYWYLYLENSPYAVVGLELPYRIEDTNWTEVDPNSKTFEKVVGLVEGFPAPGAYTYGAFILDSQGRQIGVWYSSLSAGIMVNPESQVVSVTTAMPWINDDGWYGSGVGVGIGSGGGGIGIRLGF